MSDARAAQTIGAVLLAVAFLTLFFSPLVAAVLGAVAILLLWIGYQGKKKEDK